MAEVDPAARTVNARIVFWGPAGSGKTMNLRVIHAKLRADNRGELQAVPTRLDPTVHYEVMPIQLGDVGGFRTQIQVVAVPGDPDQGPTRKQLLDRVDGIVFVADAQRDRLDANVASYEELRTSLAAYGRALDQVPLVVQYNKCDLSDPYTLEELHRKLETRGAAAFEAVAHQGKAVLPTLTTISKRVIRSLRDRPAAPAQQPAGPAATQILEPPGPAATQLLEPEAAPAAEVPKPASAPAAAEFLEPEAAPAFEPAALEDALLEEAGQAQRAAAAAETARHAQAALESLAPHPHPDAMQPLDTLPPDATQPLAVALTGASLTLDAVGTPEKVSDTEVRIPLSLRDAQGVVHFVTLSLSTDGSG